MRGEARSPAGKGLSDGYPNSLQGQPRWFHLFAGSSIFHALAPCNRQGRRGRASRQKHAGSKRVRRHGHPVAEHAIPREENRRVTYPARTDWLLEVQRNSEASGLNQCFPEIVNRRLSVYDHVARAISWALIAGKQSSLNLTLLRPPQPRKARCSRRLRKAGQTPTSYTGPWSASWCPAKISLLRPGFAHQSFR